MAQSREQIEKALEWAKQNNDEAAVRGLTNMLEQQASPPEEPAGALPENYRPGEASLAIAEQSDPLPSSPLEKAAPSTEKQISAGLERRLAREQKVAEVEAEKPWGEPTQKLLDDISDQLDEKEQAKWKKAQKQYDADQALLEDPANIPSKDEIKNFIRMHERAAMPPVMTGAVPPLVGPALINQEGRQVVRDPQTGRLRWTALPPAALYGKKKPTLGGLLIDAAGSETVRAVGRRIEDMEQHETGIKTMHGFMFNSLSQIERERVRGELAKLYGVDASKMTDDIIRNKVAPGRLKEVIDQNPENRRIYDEITSQEGGVLERFKRAGTKASRALAGAITLDPVKDELIDRSNIFGAESPEGGLFTPDTPMAYWLEQWEERASGRGVQGQLLERLVTDQFNGFDPDFELGASINVLADKIQEDAYGEEYERFKKPLLKPGTELTSEDLLSWDTYFSEEAALSDPKAVMVKMAEQLPNMAPSIAAGWGLGKLSGRMFSAGRLSGDFAKQSIAEVQRMSIKRGLTNGMIGQALGNSIVYDHVASEIRDALSQTPDDIIMASPKIKAMMAVGLTFEEAKQLAVQEVAASAGKGAWAGSSALGMPTGALSGLGGAGTLLGRQKAMRLVSAFLLSPAEEGFQELYEGEISDFAIEAFDPENPVLKDKGRYAERFFGGAVLALGTAAPMEAAAALETSPPAGVTKEDQKAAQLTMDFIDARNERFAQELKTSDPNYMKRTGSVRRLEAYERLQSLQDKEADAILAMEGPVREYMKNNIVPDREADAAMLNSLVRFANSQKTDIAIAKANRTTAKQMLEAHEALMQERVELQQRVNNRLLELEDIKRLQSNLTLAMEQEPLTLSDLEELIENEYVVTVGESFRPIITPKGRRALKNLGLVRLNLETALNLGYSGQERRSPENLARRDQINKLSEEDRENILRVDAATGVPNKRAFDERAFDDAGKLSTEAIAVIETDSIEFINEKLQRAAGDRLLSRVAGTIEDAVRQVVAKGIQEMGGDELDQLQLYRISGKEFALTGPNEELLERILQQAADDLSQDTISDGTNSVTPSVTWGKGGSLEAAEKQAVSMRVKRVNEGKIADRRQPPKGMERKPGGRMQALDKELEGTTTRRDFLKGAVAAATAAVAPNLNIVREPTSAAAAKVIEKAVALMQYTSFKYGPLENLKSVDQKAFVPAVTELLETRYNKMSRAAETRDFNDSEKAELEQLTDIFTRPDYKTFIEDKVNAAMDAYNQRVAEARRVAEQEEAEAYTDERYDIEEPPADVPREYGQISDVIERGDIVEILTPHSAQFGMVTRTWGGSSRPRLEVTLDGRNYRFNPEKNWLINHPISSAEDIAWITNDETMLDPANIPQTIEDVQIGLMGKGGDNWYADLSTELITDQMTLNDFKATYTEPKRQRLRAATREESSRAEAVMYDFLSRFSNAPDINLIDDVEAFRVDEPELYHQILAEAKASGLASLNSVRGYYDPLHPEAGVYVFVPNVAAVSGLDGTNFEQLIQETIFHEIVGHYGVRALFRNERELEEAMFELVDAFNVGRNSLAKRMEAQLSLFGATSKDFDPARKLLLGEEMLAYTVGLEMSNQLDLTPKQKSVIRKIIDWIKAWLNKYFGQYNDKFVSMTDQRVEFWNDDRVRDLVSRATDFVRRGPPYKKTQYEHGRTPFMRDGDIFKWNLQQVFRTATRKLSKADRKQMSQKYGGIQNVPKEVPLIPHTGTVKQYESAIRGMVSPNNKFGISPFESEALALDPNSEWYFFRDLTYSELMRLHAKTQNRKNLTDVDRDWYKQYMPHNLAQELDGIFAALDKMSMVGPLKETAKEHDKFILDIQNYEGLLQYDAIRRVTNPVSYQMMAARINEILAQPISKNTKLNWDVFEQHMNSDRSFQVYAEGNRGFRVLGEERVANMLFNGNVRNGNWLYEDGRNGMDSIEPEQREMIREAMRLIAERGPDIGYNPETGEWNDDPQLYQGTWQEYVPVGAKLDEDYRIHLVKTKGGKFPELPEAGEMDYHFAPNYMHIRSSVAELVESIEGMEALNPKYDNRALLVIEGQTDLGAHWRKGFESAEQAREADARGRQFFNALESAHNQGTIKVDRFLVDAMIELTMPMIASLPDSDIESVAVVEEVQEAMETKAIEKYGVEFKDLSVAQTQEIWQLEYIARNETLVETLNKTTETLKKYLDDNYVNLQKLRSLDARLFDALDQHAANTFIRHVYDAMKALARQFTLMPFSDPAQATTRNIRRSIAALVDKERWRNSDQSRLRIPWVKDRIAKVMGEAFAEIPNHQKIVDDVLSIFNVQPQTTYTMSKEALLRLYDAAQIEKLRSQEYRSTRTRQFEEDNKHYTMAMRLFQEYARNDFFKNIQTVNGPDNKAMAIMADSPIHFSFDTTDPDNLGIVVSASPEALAVFDLYKDDIVEDYIRKIIPLNLQSVAENQGMDNRAVKDLYATFANNWMDKNSDLRRYLMDRGDEYWEPDPLSPDGDDLVKLNDHGVEHRDDWENYYRDEAEGYVRENFDRSAEAADRGYDEDSDEYLRLMEEESEEAADEWLEERREEVEEEWENSDAYYEAIEEEIDSLINSRLENENATYLFVTDIPIEWDADGDVLNSVEFKIVASEIGEAHYVWVDNDWKDYYYSEDEAWRQAPHIIRNYYRTEGIFPPVGEMMGPDNDAEVEQLEKAKGKIDTNPNLEPLVQESRGQYKPKSSEYIELNKAFKQMVEIDKKFNLSPSTDPRAHLQQRFYPYNPLVHDKRWRVTMLRYILADAVRRGFGAVVWQEGLATATRGGHGMGNEDRVGLQRIEWTREVVTIGGKDVETYVIDSPDLREPIVVTEQNMVQVMGLKMSSVMKEQAAGRWMLPSDQNSKRKPVIKLPYTAAELQEKGQYVINEVVSEINGRVSYSVHNVLDGSFVGFYATEADAQATIDAEEQSDYGGREFRRIERRIENIMSRQESSLESRTLNPNREMVGKKQISSGVILPHDIGASALYVIPGNQVNQYHHTFSVPKLAGARMNYEQMTYDAWNQELKKYGAKIQTSYIKQAGSNQRAYSAEGQRGRLTATKENYFADVYGDTEIVEIAEPKRGWVVMTEKHGPYQNKVHPSYSAALAVLESMKESAKDQIEDIEVFTIVLNDEIKNKFIKPVSAFQQDKRLEEPLKSARSKIISRTGGTIAERVRKFRAKRRDDAWQHKYVDMLFGLRRALLSGEVSDRSYMSARIALAGMEARTKSALYYGWPTWDEDTTSYAGFPLMDVFVGAGSDPNLLGEYMLGMRSKELMLEGYDKLPEEEQKTIAKAVETLEGDTVKEKIWSYISEKAKTKKVSLEQVYSLTAEDRAELGPVASEFYERNLYHFRIYGDPILKEDGKRDERFDRTKGLIDWQKQIAKNGPVVDMRKGDIADTPISYTKSKKRPRQLGIHDDPEMTAWGRKQRNMAWKLMDDPRVVDEQGRVIGTNGKPMRGRYSKWDMHHNYGVETLEEAHRIIDMVQEKALEKQAAKERLETDLSSDFESKVWESGREKVFTNEEIVALTELGKVYPQLERMRAKHAEWNKHFLDFVEESGIINPETRPFWESQFHIPMFRVVDDRLGGAFGTNSGIHPKKAIHRLEGGMPADKVAQVVHGVLHNTNGQSYKKALEGAYNKKLVKQAVEAGYIEQLPNPNMHPDEIMRRRKETGDKDFGAKNLRDFKKYEANPRYRSTQSGKEYLVSKGNNVGDPITNILMNTARLLDAAVTNHWKKMAIDDLIETGEIKKSPVAVDTGLVPMSEIVKILKDSGFNTDALPPGFAESLQKVTTINPLSEKDGYISIFRNGKREYYQTDNRLLYESITLYNRKNFHHNWSFLTVPKKFYTGTITLSPAFMGANAFRDAISASISGRDEIIPFVDSMKGFVHALKEDEVMRTLTSGGASFEAGFITGGDTKAVMRQISKARLKADFVNSILDSPIKFARVNLMLAADAYMHMGSSFENASRVALYKAAMANGKSKLRGLYEALDIMDFSMRGNSTSIQWLCAVVPFLNARLQGNYRTARGARERPLATLIKGTAYMFAALGVWALFRDDERYEELQAWDKMTYHHFWIGDEHFRLPRAFEVGALFTAIPEAAIDTLYQQESDGGKQLLRMYAHILGETFALNPVPQGVQPITEFLMNYNFFTQRQIVSPYDNRLPQDQFGPRTSVTMRELAKFMPAIEFGKGNLASPKHLENLYRGYTGTLGQYALAAADWMVRQGLDYPLPPTRTPAQNFLTGRFYLGDNPPYRTKQEEEFYRMMEKVTSIQQSINFYERTEIDDERLEQILDTEAPYINVIDDLEDIREDIRELNREEMEIEYDFNMTRDEKREAIDSIVRDRNQLFKEAYELRPGTELNPVDRPATKEKLLKLITDWGINDSELALKRLKEEAASTAEVLEFVKDRMETRNLRRLAQAGNE